MQRIISRQPLASFITPWLWSPDDLLGESQAVLAALADLECRYAEDCERWERDAGAGVTDEPSRAERERRHQEECEPFLRRLNELDRRIRALASGR